MNFTLSYSIDQELLDQMAEKLLEREYSISYQTLNGIEFLSASLHNAVQINSFFLAFDPVKINAAVFLSLLYLLKEGVENHIHIVVPAEGEREILLNILQMQEIVNINVTSLSEFSLYPLQVVR